MRDDNTIMTTKLTGQQSRCAACSLLFTSISAFEAHRVGDYSARRCLSADELTAKGHAPNAYGYWRKPMDAEKGARVIAAKRAA